MTCDEILTALDTPGGSRRLGEYLTALTDGLVAAGDRASSGTQTRADRIREMMASARRDTIDALVDDLLALETRLLTDAPQGPRPDGYESTRSFLSCAEFIEIGTELADVLARTTLLARAIDESARPVPGLEITVQLGLIGHSIRSLQAALRDLGAADVVSGSIGVCKNPADTRPDTTSGEKNAASNAKPLVYRAPWGLKQ